jgi:predicted HTH transcriptional regulator
MPESTSKNIVDILERLGLRVNGSLLNAAFVLFGKKFMPYYPQCQLRLARFKGRDKSEFLDHKQIRGHAFYLLEEATTFFHRHLAISGKFEENRMERIDKPVLPTLALREALVNAICHRDYSLPGGAVSVAIYDDRAEIWSDGTLPFGLKPEDLSREHTSKPRNPIITDVFFRRGLIEQWGRGTQKIIELCENSGAPTPEFNELAGTLRVRFPLHEEITPQVSPQDTPQVTPQDNTQDNTQDSTQDNTQDSTHDITHIKPEIKRLLTNLHGNMSRNDLLNAFNFKSTKNLRKRYLVPALEQGFIEMTIPEKPNSRNQRYRLTEKGRVVKKQLEK